MIILSVIRLSNPRPYALEMRTVRVAEALAALGAQVTLVTMDGVRDQMRAPHLDADTDSLRVRASDSTEGRRLPGPLAAALLFVRLLHLPNINGRSRNVVVFQPGWIPFAAMLYKAIRPETILHFDVPGIPHEECALAKYRFWRAKATVFEWLFQNAIQKSDVITTVNLAHVAYIREHRGREAEVIADLPSPARLESLLALPASAIGPDSTVLYVGSISRSRLDTFLNVARKLIEARDDVDFVIAGEGEDLERYRRDFQSKRITFPGYLRGQQLFDRLGAAEICYSDVWSNIGTPVKVIEYMAASRAVVTHDTPSTRELIKDGINGLLCAEGEGPLYGAIVRLLNDANLRSRLGRAARQTVQLLVRDDLLPGSVRAYLVY